MKTVARITLIIVSVIIVSATNPDIGKSADKGEKNVAAIKKAAATASAECAKIGKQLRPLCDSVVAWRYREYLAHYKKLQQMTSENRIVLSGIESSLSDLGKRCSKQTPRTCERLRLLQQQKKEIVTLQNTNTKLIKTMTERVQQAMTGNSVLLKQQAPSIICKRRDVGNIECASLGSILGQYDNEFDSVILKDIGRLYDVNRFDPRLDVLIGCGPGVWGAAKLSDFDVSSIEPLQGLTQTQQSQKLGEICSKLEVDGGDLSHPDDSIPGFSGRTGIDRSGTLGCSSVGGSSSGTDFIDGAMKLAEKMHEACSDSFQEGMMAGVEDPQPPPPDPPNPKPDDPPPPPDPPNPPTDPKVVKQEQQKEEKTDQTTGKKVIVTTTVTTYEDGKVVTQTMTVDADSGKLISGDIITKRPDGSKALTSFYRTDAGGTHYDQWNKTADGSMFRAGWEWDKGGKHRTWLYSGPCAGEPCSTCGGMATVYAEQMSSCLGSGGKSLACRNFGAGTECCGNSKMFVGDPRVLMPNPNGDYGCYGSSMNVDIQKETCNKRCSVASSEEPCMSSCLNESPDRMGGFNILDRVCQEANWDACYIAVNFEIPSYLIPPIGLGPTPLPTDKYLLFPPGTTYMDPMGKDIF